VKTIVGIDVPVIYEPSREGDIKKSVANISKAKEIMGYAPKYSIREGLEHTVSPFR
jgi:UDP-glucose 4-epimerase